MVVSIVGLAPVNGTLCVHELTIVVNCATRMN